MKQISEEEIAQILVALKLRKTHLIPNILKNLKDIEESKPEEISYEEQEVLE